MASRVPSFINRSVDYDDLFGDEDKETIPIDATPISRIRATPTSQEKSSTSSKRKLPLIPSESAKTTSSRPLKKTRHIPAHDESSPGSKAQLFARMISNQISEKTIADWDKMTLTDAAKAIPLANAQSLFHYLKHGEEIVEAARGDQRMVQEIHQLKALLKVKDDEKKKLVDAGKKMKASETKLNKERDQLNATIIKLDTEKDEIAASHAEMIKELEQKLDALHSTVAAERTTHKEDKKAKYLAGYNNGIKDYFRSAFEKFPDVDWAQLGEDAAAMVKEFQDKATKDIPSEADHTIPTPKVKESEADAKVQEEELKSAEPVPDQTTPESISEASAH